MITYILREDGKNCTSASTRELENRLDKLGGCAR